MSTVAHGHPACTTGSVRRIPRHNVTCGAQQSGLKHEPARPADMDRRSTLFSIGTSAAAALVAIAAPPGAIAKGKTQTAGDFLPPTSDGYVLYTPNGQSTPSIRAGVIKQEDGFYTFELPAKWVEGTILNILSGNFCMPGCNEPWVEALWESPTEGAAKLVVSPLYRLINKPNATLKDVGTPEAVAEKIGAFITGNYLDSIEDVNKHTRTFWFKPEQKVLYTPGQFTEISLPLDWL